MIGSTISVLSGLAGIHSWFSGLRTGQIQERLLDEVVRTRSSVERLAEHILYIESISEVKDINKTKQERIASRQAVYDLLAPIQRNVKDDLLSTAVVVTPEKLQRAFAKDPWEVLVGIRPADRVKKPTNPDVVPVMFVDNDNAYIGWQTKGAFPVLFDCDYQPDEKLYLPFGDYSDARIVSPDPGTSLPFNSVPKDDDQAEPGSTLEKPAPREKRVGALVGAVVGAMSGTLLGLSSPAPDEWFIAAGISGVFGGITGAICGTHRGVIAAAIAGMIAGGILGGLVAWFLSLWGGGFGAMGIHLIREGYGDGYRNPWDT